MKIQIENLKAYMQGRDLTIHQKADALIEFNKLLDYVEELVQCNIADVVESACDDYVDGIDMQCARCDQPKYKH